MKKFYWSKIEQVTEGGMTFYRHRFQAYPDIEYKGGEIKVDAGGVPTEKGLLILVAAKDHTPFEADDGLLAIPVGQDGLKVKLGAIDTPTRLDFRSRLADFGHDATDIEALTDNTKSFMQTVNDLGQRNNPAFDVNNFDLDES